MTFLEKFKQDHPDAQLDDDDGYPFACPDFCGEEMETACDIYISCQECWDREMTKEV